MQTPGGWICRPRNYRQHTHHVPLQASPGSTREPRPSLGASHISGRRRELRLGLGASPQPRGLINNFFTCCPRRRVAVPPVHVSLRSPPISPHDARRRPVVRPRGRELCPWFTVPRGCRAAPARLLPPALRELPRDAGLWLLGSVNVP